jgi:iron complex transport system substrate-binding protein
MIASSTEIVCALGCEDLLVGRSHECDFPNSIQNLPVTTEIKFAADGTSYQIDQRVKAILQEGLSVYRVQADLLKRLKPDVILTQTQCEVCAVSLKDVEDATWSWLGSKPQIVSLHPNALEDLWKNIEQVAEALNVKARGQKLITKLKDRIEALRLRAAQISEKAHRSRVACLEWLNPLMAAGNWVPELVELAGGVNLFGEAGKHSPFMSWDDLKAKNPDLIVVMPCGFDIEKTQSEMSNLTAHPDWNRLKAVREQRVYVADGNQYFNRPGPRLIDSLEVLIEIFYPHQVTRKYDLNAWVSLG